MAEGNSEERATGMASSQFSEGLSSSQSHASGQTGGITPTGASGVPSAKSRRGRGHGTSGSSQSFSETTGSVDSQQSPTSSTSALKQLKHETRQVSEKLGSLLNSRPYVGQTEQFKQELQAVSQSQQLSLGSVINYPIKRYNDRTCVHLAATNGLWECLEILMKSGGNPNATSSLADLCQTPLHLAAEKGYAKCSSILLDHGADMTFRNSQQNKPMDMIRGKRNCEQVFQQAMSKGQIPPRSKEQQQTVKDLHNLLKDGKDPVKFYQLYDSLPPIHRDLSTRWTDWDRQTLLCRACAMESVDIVEHMLSKSPKNQPLRNTSDECNPLHIACQKNNIEITKKLLSHSPKLLFLQAGKEKLSPLHIVCSNGNNKMVQLILDQICLLIQSGDQLSLSLDVTDHLGHTPFFYACARGDTAIVKLLTEFQANHSYKVTLNVNSAEPYQSTPLHAAIQSGIVEVVKMLLHVKGINLNAKARPAERTQGHCLRILEHNLHGRVIPVQEATDEKEVRSTDAISVRSSTPEPTLLSYGTSAPNSSSFYTPHSTAERDIKDLLGISLPNASESYISSEVHTEDKSHGPKKRTAITSKTRRFSKKPLGGRSRATTRADTINLGETSIGIFEAEYGKLQLLPLNESSGHKSFNQLLVTPLAEACAYGNAEIVNLLLQYGAQDDDGLAHRISSFIHLPDIAWSVLAHHCIVLERGVGEKGATDTAARLQLQWNSRNLSVLDGSWFSNTSEYFPVQRQKEDDDGDTGYSSRMNLPQQLQLQYTSSITKYNGFNIKVVHLQQNHLQSIPLEMFYLPNVEEINLSNNRCTELPENVSGWKCVHLKKLDLSHNLLVSLPSSVWVLPALRKLVATHNNLATLLQDEKKFEKKVLSRSLEHIDFSNNHLIELPSFLFLLPSLKKVFLSLNKLQSLPDTVWSSTTIQELLVNHNHLTYLPRVEPVDSHFSESVCKAPDVVQRSERAVTGIFEVRPRFESSLGKSSRPQISVRGTRPVTIKQDVSLPAAGVDSSEYSSLTKLNIANNRLQAFPVGLPCFVPNLTELDVSNNSFKKIDIQFIPQLIVKFTARNCEIERFGNVLTQTSHTEVVKCCLHEKTFGYPCQHRKHPRLPNLTNLKLSGNRLKYFQILYHQPLESDDEEPIEKDQKFDPNQTSMDILYPALEALELSGNNLQGEFNPNIGHQSHLKQIQLDKNPQLQKIPMQFAYLRKTRQLTELQINDLPNLIEPPQEYQNKQVSINHLLTYMRSRLKESQQYRTIKLFLIGDEKRGKTTLLRRLKSIHECVVDRTVGIDIEDWIYSEPKKFLKSASKPVHFLIWDFAGQGVYHTSHQCFYSRRSLYLAVFRLTDDIQGVEELEPWLRNVQLRAPGCPVIIVGTHLDILADEQRAIQLQKLALERYKDTSFYPKIVCVEIVSSVKSRVFSISYIEKLRRHIYNIACHLQVSSDGGTLEYKPDMPQDDPKALFQQKVPVSFLNLQDAIRQEVATRAVSIMDEKTFKATFKDQCEDEDELNEAVYFLHMQGTLLHFEDHGLRDVYFLDPQWLAKLMANVIYPAAQDANSPIQNGIGKTEQLFTQQDIPDGLKEQYIQLLEKFELALRIGHEQVIIPSLMQDCANYPPISGCPSDLTNYIPPLRRFWVSNYIPDGFWPRLICRIASDQQINKVLQALSGETRFSPVEGSGKFDKLHEFTVDDLDKWIPWKTGIAHAQQDHTLVVIKQENNEKSEEKLKWIKGTFTIEVHINVPEWIMLAKKHGELNNFLANPNYVHGLATSLIVMISQHVRALGSDWFPGMFLTPSSHHQFTTYMPCWKCFAQIETDAEQQPPKSSGGYISKDGKPIYSFIFEESVVPAVQQKDMECPLHGLIKVVEIAPDLIFWDLQQSTFPHEADMTLKINSGDVLGKGGYGFVCKGELASEYDTKTVAVKVFLQKTEGPVGQSTIAELLNVSLNPRNLLHAYQEIRQEIAILANLNHPNLTELCGVRTHPHMCLLLELAPKTSLRAMLKQYKECNLVLEPLTLKTSAVQIAAGLEYLHRHQIVHLDMKSANVLVWYFPSPKHDGIITSKQERMKLAGNVWLKLADYGISQVSTTSTIKLEGPAVGTPGYMAPEVFHTGQQVSSEKVDVFAFGMTLYELLSQKVPFSSIVPAIKRNREVINKQRPLLEARETRSLVLFQRLMKMCWSHSAEERPRMEQVHEWASSDEFGRLRTEINLKDVASISCVCITRITPDNKKEKSPIHFQPIDKSCHFSGEATEMVTGLSGNILYSASKYSCPIEEQSCSLTTAGLQFQPLRASPDPEAGGDEAKQHCQSYTQIWLCSRGKGLLQIFTYYDGQPGAYTFSGYCSKDEVRAICPVGNTVWMGTSTGTLKIFHAPTLQAQYARQLHLEVEGLDTAGIIEIRHVKEACSVLVATGKGEIWSFLDHVISGGLKIQDRILSLINTTNITCNRMVTVNYSQESVEVWGTMSENRIFVLKPAGGGLWRKQDFEPTVDDSNLRACLYIAHASFSGRNGLLQNHVWHSYRSKAVLVCWDAETKQQRHVLDCAKAFKEDTRNKSTTFQVEALNAHGQKVFVGTSGGTVGVFNSETCSLMKSFSWYIGKVQALLVLPKEAEHCICAEIPYDEKQHQSSSSITASQSRNRSQISAFENIKYVPNREPEAVMITSIGKGRKRFIVKEPSSTEGAAVRRVPAQKQDVCLQIWRASC